MSTGKFAKVLLVEPVWLKAGLHSFSIRNLLTREVKLARVDGQQGKIGKNLQGTSQHLFSGTSQCPSDSKRVH